MSEKTKQKYPSKQTQHDRKPTAPKKILYHFEDINRIGALLPDGTIWIPGRDRTLVDPKRYRTQYEALYRRFTRAYIAKLTGNAQSAEKHFEASMFAFGKHYFTDSGISEKLRKFFRDKYVQLRDIAKHVDTITDSDDHEIA